MSRNSQIWSTQRPVPAALGASTKRETAQYIAEISLEMRHLAKSLKMTTLQGLLEVVYYEAFTLAAEIELPEGEAERLRELSQAATR